MLETEIEDEEQTNHFFDEGGHWKAEHSPLDLELSESAVYSEEFWLIFETCLTPARQTSQDFYDERVLELSSEEICQENQLSISNLHTTLYRARLQLQNCLSHKL